MWTEVSIHICNAGQDENVHELQKASKILIDIAILEEEAMKTLLENRI